MNIIDAVKNFVSPAEEPKPEEPKPEEPKQLKGEGGATLGQQDSIEAQDLKNSESA